MRSRKPFKQILIDHVDKRGENECWPWTGHIGKNGYGKAVRTIKYGGISDRKQKTYRAHRAYLIFVAKKKVPKDAYVCHTCDNPPCCNPNHLVIGDAKWNNADMVKKGRNVILRGENSALAKLSDKQVAIIKKALSDHRVSAMEIQDRFHISEPNVRKIINGSRWKHIYPFGSIETVMGNRRPNAMSKHLRLSIRKYSMKETAKHTKLSMSKLRILAYPLAPGYKYGVK